MIAGQWVSLKPWAAGVAPLQVRRGAGQSPATDLQLTEAAGPQHRLPGCLAGPYRQAVCPAAARAHKLALF
jgi:hypothetical protein